VTALVVFLTTIVAAQNSLLSFEVASVKANRMVGPQSMLIGCQGGAAPVRGIAPGTCRAVHSSLEDIIAEAYDIPFMLEDQTISDAPSWISRERYDIEAKAEHPSASASELKIMLQNLLADRFKLSLHEQTKEVSGYALVVAKGGAKFTPPLPGKSLACGTSTAEALARCLSRRLGQPVVDKTGITGRHNFSLTMESLGEDQIFPPSIFTVLEEQFGLKLVSQKVPLRILVIDHVERPSEN
jgi:uncharacterized protein (TIGR03435 family)